MTPINCAKKNPTMNKHDNSTRVKAPAFSIPDFQACPRKTNEGASLNPFRREVPGGTNRGNKLMNSKRYLQKCFTMADLMFGRFLLKVVTNGMDLFCTLVVLVSN